MGYTLDQLLDQTGVNRITGAHLTKEAAAAAAAPHDLFKLAERCRRAVDASPDEHDSAVAHGLAEKTAAVAVIRRAMAEIAAIDAGEQLDHEKTAAASDPREAIFVAAALGQGHSPEAIAGFLEKDAGIFGRARRGVENWRAARGTRKAVEGVNRAKGKLDTNFRKWQGIVEKSRGLSEAERGALVSRMKLELGPATAIQVFQGTPGAAKGFQNLQAFKDMKAALPAANATAGVAAAAPKKALSATIGGAEVGLTSKQLQSMKKPALYLGGGALAHKAISGGGGDKPSGKRGVVVVNS